LLAVARQRRNELCSGMVRLTNGGCSARAWMSRRDADCEVSRTKSRTPTVRGGIVTNCAVCSFCLRPQQRSGRALRGRNGRAPPVLAVAAFELRDFDTGLFFSISLKSLLYYYNIQKYYSTCTTVTFYTGGKAHEAEYHAPTRSVFGFPAINSPAQSDRHESQSLRKSFPRLTMLACYSEQIESHTTADAASRPTRTQALLAWLSPMAQFAASLVS
jgi:hypothetical protein